MMLENFDAVAQAKRRLLSRRADFAAGAYFLFGAALVAVLDVWIGLPQIVRWVATLGLLAMAATFISRMRMRGFGTRDAARALEAHSPALGQSVRTAVQVAQSRGKRSQVADALVSLTEKRIAFVNFAQFARVPFLRAAAVGAALLLAFWIAGLIASPDWRTATLRLTGVNRSFTRIAVAAEPGEVVSEQPARVQASIAGRGVGSAVLHLREEGGDWREVAMHAGSAHRFDAVLASVPRSLEFFVTAGDGRSPVVRVACHIPAKLEAVSARLVFPEYTGLAPVEKKSGDLEAVEDTRAGLDFVFNRGIAEARIVFSDETSVPVAVEAASGHASVTVGKKELKWHLAGKDSGGLAFESPSFRLKGIADKLPEIKLLEPRDEIEVTPLHELLARFRAKDDFGLAKVGVVLKVGNKTEPLFEKEFAARDVKDAAEMATAFLEKYPLTINDNVQVYAYATDHKPRGGARAITPLVNVDIREYQRRFVFSNGPACKCMNVLETLISKQRRVFSDTAQFAEMSMGQELSAGLVAPLAARERKVARATDELIEKLRGMSAFAESGEAQLAVLAQEQMQAAADLLDALALPAATESENEALSTLLKLRRQMIKKLGTATNGGQLTNKSSENDGP
ncbi:MAG: hypothetical protein ABIZ56_09540, partial [Chthoniobacteraceae bacterium]